MRDIYETEPFTPTAEHAPLRGPGGAPILPRVTTTHEQTLEVVQHFTEVASSSRARAVRGRIEWPGREATVLEVRFSVEHIEGDRVWLPDTVTEETLDGGVIERTEDDRLRLLQDQVEELHDRGLL